MNFIESRLLGIRVDERGLEAFISIIDKNGARFDLELHGVERLTVNEMRQHNIIEDIVHWTNGDAPADLREAAFFLMTGVAEQDCSAQLAKLASATADRVIRGELEILEITAIFGAQVIASFASMTMRPAP